MKELFNTIFKRKTIRKFDQTLFLTDEELIEIENHTQKLMPLDDEIKVEFKIVKRSKTTAKRGEYCLLIYSEKKPHYLLNAGYLLEQMDLFLTSQNIGVCWYALAKPTEKFDDALEYVIMLAFGKSRSQDFRNDISQFKRKAEDMIWKGSFDRDVIEAVRLSPSACNTQPWRIFSDNHSINIYRDTTIKSFIPASKLPYYNSIDMGICLCFLEISLLQKGFTFSRELATEESTDLELLEIAKYSISPNNC